MFRVPQQINDEENLRAARWLHNIGTGHDVKTYNFTQDKVVCEDHFHSDCFQIDKMAILLNYIPKSKKLVPGAVPTLFNHKTFDQINMDGTVVTTRAKRVRDQHNDNDIMIIDENYRISPVGKISKTSLWWSLFFVNFAHWEWTECDTLTQHNDVMIIDDNYRISRLSAIHPRYNDVMIIDENYRISRSSAIRTRDGDVKET